MLDVALYDHGAVDRSEQIATDILVARALVTEGVMSSATMTVPVCSSIL